MNAIKSWIARKKITPVCFGLFLIRFGVGLIFVFHGIDKLMNLPQVFGFFTHIVLPGSGQIGVIMAVTVALIETVGGFALILGIGTRIAGILLASIMLGVLLTVKRNAPLYGGSEYELVLLLTSLGLCFTGSGRIAMFPSLSWCKDCGSMECKTGACAPAATPSQQ